MRSPGESKAFDTMRDQFREPRQRRLRKQPKMRRVQSASIVSSPKLTVPKTAKQRRRRNSRVRPPIEAMRRFVFSARWVSLGVLALSIYALALIGMDEHFYLSPIPVQGAVSISPAEVVEASGLASLHVFAADPNLAAAKITDLPGVIAANVTLKWPNQVSIQVQEDSPIAIWQEGLRQFWITEDGTLIPARSGVPGLLVIESEMPVPVAGDEETGRPETSLDFIPEDVLQGALLMRRLRPNIDRLYYRPSYGLSYQDGRGWRAHFGTGADMQQKLVVYETIVEQLLSQGLTPEYISVSNQEKPYYSAR